MPPLEKTERPHLLLVEGSDEVAFFQALCRYIDIGNIQIEDVEGKENFKKVVRTIVQVRPGRELIQSIGLVRDADGNAKGAFDSLCNALNVAGLPVPEAALQITGTQPRISCLVLPPNGEETGYMLEDLCLAAVRDDVAVDCVDKYIACLADNEIILRDNVIAKAKFYAFLASRYQPEYRLGLAARQARQFQNHDEKHIWNWDAPVFDAVKVFLQQLVS
jgi:hypothetical protein